MVNKVYILLVTLHALRKSNKGEEFKSSNKISHQDCIALCRDKSDWALLSIQIEIDNSDAKAWYS